MAEEHNMKKNNSVRKSYVIIIITLFIFSSISSSICGYSESNDLTEEFPSGSDNLQENSKVTCHTFGLPGESKQEVTMSSNEAGYLYNKIKNLQIEVARNPLSDETQQLQQDIISFADDFRLLPNGLSLEEVKILLSHSRFKQFPKNLNLPILSGRASQLFCTFVTAGSGAILPIIALPRLIPILMTPIPRLFMIWNSKEAITSCGGLLSGTGYIAYGQQTGIALGFWGMGFTFSIPPLMGVYGLIGYALFARVKADNIELYPPNSHPVISDVNPPKKSKDIPITLSELSFRISDADGERMDYIVETSPDIGSANEQNKEDGTYTVPVNGLEGSTEYEWKIKVTDGEDWTNKTFTFTTVPIAPLVSDPNPSDGSKIVPVSLDHLNFTIADYQGDLMDYTVETSPDIGSDAASGVGNGTYSVPVGGLDYFTEYTWYVNLTDGANWKHEKFSFRTLPEGVIIIHPTDDAMINHRNINFNYGSHEHMCTRNNYGGGSGWAYDTLIKFDISSVPTNATIYYAYLKLYYYKSKDTNPAGRDLNCFRATSDWNEETVTWNTQPTYASQPTTYATVPSSKGVWMEWDVTSDIFDFLNGGLVNYGWKVTDDTYWGKGNIPITYFRTKEYNDFIPYLEIGTAE